MRLLLPLVAAVLLTTAAPAAADTFTVTSTADGAGACASTSCTTIRAALTAAGANAGADTIQLAGQRYNLTQQAGGALLINSDVTIQGATGGGTIVAGDGKNFRIFTVTGSGRQATIAYVHATFGTTNILPQADRLGGIVLADAGTTLRLDHDWIDAGSADRGGGVAARMASVTITKSLIANNTATPDGNVQLSADGGGILVLGATQPATLNISDSTVAFNGARTAVGIESTGNAGNAVTLTRVSVVHNNSTGSVNSGSGLNRAAGTFRVGGSIVADNAGDSTQDNCTSGITSLGNNVETSNQCGFTATGDQVNVANGNQTLVTETLTNAGVSQVLPLPAGSPAIDKGGACTGADQRDLPRPQGSACDVGAYEVDQVPDTKLDSTPPATTGTSPSFSFSSPEPGVTFECSLSTAAASYSACASPQTYSGVAAGTYTFSVRAKDSTGNTDATPATYKLTVDATTAATAITSGPNGVTTDSAPAFAFASDDTKATFECRLDGPAATVGAYTACTSPDDFSGLAPGAYTFFVRTTNALGNRSVASRSFTVAAVQQAPPPPTPSPTPTPPPVPILGKTVVIAPLRGTTLIKLPGAKAFTKLDVTKGIPIGSTVDTRHSEVQITSKTGSVAKFYDGLFKITQTGGLTTLVLTEQLAPCGKSASIAAKKPKTRKLWGDGSGAFSTRGQYSAATVRGTKWLVQDSCGKTLTRVAKGVVSVRDLVKRKTILLRAPHSYTARKKH